MKWISTKERLPEEGQEVLFYDSRYKDIEYNQYYRGANGNYYFGATEAENITHWFLPAPPSAEEILEERVADSENKPEGAVPWEEIKKYFTFNDGWVLEESVANNLLSRYNAQWLIREVMPTTKLIEILPANTVYGEEDARLIKKSRYFLRDKSTDKFDAFGRSTNYRDIEVFPDPKTGLIATKEKVEEVQKEKEFKVGMKVRVVKNLFKGKWPPRDEECPIGCVFLVKLIKLDGYRGRCEEAGVKFKPFIKVYNGWEFHPDELEIVEE